MEEHLIDAKELSNLKIEFLDSEYVVTLIDHSNFEILKGYGKSIVTAINDLHENLV